MFGAQRRTAASGPSLSGGQVARHRLAGAAAAIVLALSTGGCSYQLFGPEKDDIKTGSIDAQPSAPVAAPRDAVSSSPLPPPPGATAVARPAAQPTAYAATSPQAAAADAATLSPSDWAYARGALSIAMAADANDASVPWANPDSGAYGSFSASSGATTQNGATCRAFTASHSAGGREQRLEGNACRTAAGHWEAVAIHAATPRSES